MLCANSVIYKTGFSMCRNRWFVFIVGANLSLFTSPGIAATKTWTTAISSSWSEPLRWTPNGVPTATDSATFNKPGDYTVYFSSVFQDLNDMAVSAGTVTFERLVSPATLSVTNASGGRDLTVGNATLNLGLTLPVNVGVGDATFVNAGGTLNVRAGSNLSTQDLTVNAGGAFAVAAGSSFTQGRNVLVDGGSFSRTAGANWTHPEFGSGGSFTAKNNAQVNFGDTITRAIRISPSPAAPTSPPRARSIWAKEAGQCSSTASGRRSLRAVRRHGPATL